MLRMSENHTQKSKPTPRKSTRPPWKNKRTRKTVKKNRHTQITGKKLINAAGEVPGGSQEDTRAQQSEDSWARHELHVLDT